MVIVCVRDCVSVQVRTSSTLLPTRGQLANATAAASAADTYYSIAVLSQTYHIVLS
jgi:hypothetical protein